MPHLSEPSNCKPDPAALALWRRSETAAGTLVERYLCSCAIRLPPPPSIRFHPTALYDHSGLHLPAMICAVQAPDRRVVAVHRTFLTMDGRANAGVSDPRRPLGAFGQGAVRLAHASETLAVAEGIETALACMQMFALPCWAACSANRLASIALPETINHVIIFANHDHAGEQGAEAAAERYTREGRKVTVRVALEPGQDWHDTLLARAREGAAA